MVTASALVSGSAGYLPGLFREFTPFGSDVVMGSLFSVGLIGVCWAFAFRGVKLSSRTSMVIEAATALIIVGLFGAGASAPRPGGGSRADRIARRHSRADPIRFSTGALQLRRA